LDIIRGRAPFSELIDIGIEIDNIEGELHLRSKLAGRTLQPDLRDVLRGFNLYRDHPERLRIWAFLLLAETAIDLSDLENTDSGRKLLDAIWEASEGESIGSVIEADKYPTTAGGE